MNNNRRRNVFAFFTLVVVLFSLIAGGCATGDSDMPWASPAPWEGSPTIPGMNR